MWFLPFGCSGASVSILLNLNENTPWTPERNGPINSSHLLKSLKCSFSVLFQFFFFKYQDFWIAALCSKQWFDRNHYFDWQKILFSLTDVVVFLSFSVMDVSSFSQFYFIDIWQVVCRAQGFVFLALFSCELSYKPAHLRAICWVNRIPRSRRTHPWKFKLFITPPLKPIWLPQQTQTALSSFWRCLVALMFSCSISFSRISWFPSITLFARGSLTLPTLSSDVWPLINAHHGGHNKCVQRVQAFPSPRWWLNMLQCHSFAVLSHQWLLPCDLLL